MNLKTIPIDVRDFLNKHSVEVFETMLAQKPVPVAEGQLPAFPERIIGSVGFGGENITGALYLHLSVRFANQIAGSMLGLPEGETPGETEVNDVTGELTNMLAGGLKSSFCDAGAPCAVSTPAIIRGTAFQIETMPDIHREIILFDCGTNRFAIEVHIKLN